MALYPASHFEVLQKNRTPNTTDMYKNST